LSRSSPAVRYLADASYWLYLVHLPLQFEISIHLAQWQANGFVKFLIYNVLTFAILIPSYHFLVRPTWLGLLLNGRLYPLKKSPDI
jgi:glucan biosynthesis protein C